MARSFIIRGIKNVSILTVGNFISQIINLIGFIVISRQLGPGNYGIFVTIGAFVSFFQIFTINQIAKVIIREGSKNTEEMTKLYEKTIGVKKALGLISILLCLIVTIFMPYSTDIKLYIGIFSFNLLYFTFGNYFYASFQVEEKFHIMAGLQILNRIFYVVFGVSALFLGLGLPGLIVFTLVSNMVSLYINYRISNRVIPFRFNTGIYLDKAILKASGIFTLLMFIGFFSTSSVDIITISFLRPHADVGYYGLAANLMAPLFIIRNLISIGIFPALVKLFHTSVVEAKKMFIFSFLFGIILVIGAVVGAFLAPYLIPWIFGEVYSKAVPIFSVLIFTMSFSFMQIPFMNALQATNNELTLLKVVWIPSFMNIFLNLIFLHYFGLIGIAYSTLVVQGFTYITYVTITYFLLKKQKRIY